MPLKKKALAVLMCLMVLTAVARGDDCHKMDNGRSRRRELVFEMSPTCATFLGVAGVGTAAGTAAAGSWLLGALGFGPIGIVGGSLAALYQSWWGTPALFSLLQSAGMVGIGVTKASIVGVVGSTVASTLIPACYVERDVDC